MSRIFINYRREDSATCASRIYEWLSERYGDDQVFMDVDTIEPGLDWRKAIDRAVGSADIVLALIGPRWLEMLERRSAEPDDPMRHELETALLRDGIRVLPVLVDGGEMPRADQLPPTLAPLTDRHALKIMRPGDERFRVDKEDLLQRVERAIGPQPETQPARPPIPAHTNGQPPAADVDQAVAVELAKWNWGAFLLTWVWGVFNGVFRSFLVLVPIYGIWEWILLGKNGNRWAWETKRWQTVEAFHSTQRKWAIAAVVTCVLLVLIVIGSSSSSGG